MHQAAGIGCDHHEQAAAFESAPALCDERDRVMNVLDHVGHGDGVKSAIGKLLLSQRAGMNEKALRPRRGNCGGIHLDALGLPAQIRHKPEAVAAAAADIEEPSAVRRHRQIEHLPFQLGPSAKAHVKECTPQRREDADVTLLDRRIAVAFMEICPFFSAQRRP